MSQLLNEGLLKDALSKLDIASVVAHLDAITFDGEVLKAFLEYVRRSNRLIIPYSDIRKQTKRDEFLDGLALVMRRLGGDGAEAALNSVRSQLSYAEDGYRRILNALSQTEFAKLKPEVRCAAAIDRAALQIADLLQKAISEASRTGVVRLQRPMIRDVENRPMSPNAAIGNLVSDLGAMLMMEAIREKWIDDGIVVLPSLPAVGEDDRYKAGSSEVLARYWVLWRQLEEQSRFLGGDIRKRVPPDMPTDTPPMIDLAYHYVPPPAVWLDFAAQHRLLDMSAQNYAELTQTVDTTAYVRGFALPVPLPPLGFISVEEAHAARALSEKLGYGIVGDKDLIEGLLLIEWLRGYVVLSTIAEERRGSEGALVGIFEDCEILDKLAHGGLTAERARIFLEAATFARGSRDLFDTPLIRLTSGRRILFGPAIIGQNYAEILMSVFATKDIAFNRKGPAFEKRVIALLQGNGVEVQSFKFKRDGAEYEYDAVALWGDYVFVFECKNRSLPGDRPIAAYHFELEARSSIKQVRRLCDALVSWPDALEERFGQSAATKAIVPVVLHNLPYARFGPTEGVYFYDFSALSRFFKEGRLHVNAVHNAGSGAKLLNKIPTARIWAGERPEPADLIVELNAPVQLRILQHHTRIFPIIFGLDMSTVGATEFFITEEVTEMTMADFSGIGRRAMRVALDKGAKKARKLRKRAAKAR